MAWAWLLAACAGQGSGPEAEHLAERLQGNWACAGETRLGEFLRSDIATLAVDSSTIKYSWNVLWDCAVEPACAQEPPKDRGGYFEGVYKAQGDSLALQDGVDTLAFRDLADSAFTFVVNGSAFPMRRR
jgi:hypothetical protein